nr:tetratricopeptide repeat protein [Allosalinactinospora lopnorensis]
MAGRYQEALESLGAAYRLFANLSNRLSQAAVLVELAATHRLLDDPTKAVESLRQAQEIFRESGDNWREATTSDDLGRLLSDQGKTAEAREAWLAALSVFESEDPERAAQTRARLEALQEASSDDLPK